MEILRTGAALLCFPTRLFSGTGAVPVESGLRQPACSLPPARSLSPDASLSHHSGSDGGAGTSSRPDVLPPMYQTLETEWSEIDSGSWVQIPAPHLLLVKSGTSKLLRPPHEGD